MLKYANLGLAARFKISLKLNLSKRRKYTHSFSSSDYFFIFKYVLTKKKILKKKIY